MRFAYADPPYPGQARKLYAAEAEADGRVAREVNHPLLVQYLCDEFPDGWTLSTSAPALRMILNLCPDDVRVCACGAIDKDGTHRTAMTWDALLASGRVIPIEEHEAALDEMADRLCQALGARDDERAKVELLREALTRIKNADWPSVYTSSSGLTSLTAVAVAGAALADTQHPSTPGGTDDVSRA